MKRRIVSMAIASIVVIASMTGCGENSESSTADEKNSSQATVSEESPNKNSNGETESGAEEVEIQTELTNQSLFDYEFLVNGQVLKLPITSKTLSQMGYEANEQDKSNGNIKLGTTHMYTFECINSETGVSISPSALNNTGDKDLDYYDNYGTEDFVFYQMMFSDAMNSGKNYDFEFTNGIKLNTSTAEDIINAFGEPDYIFTKYNDYVYFENPDAVTDKSDPNNHESGFVRFGLSESGNLEAIICAKQD